ncbi:DUF6531 domain-containing protein [Amycolatopsis magusensis]|uniref:RHS repeat-associated protein n=1 Tax=Amycolatopsis magusensis TaxID=882444 RepID=A0ABS4PJ99_9PSEU|nr:DUF6531 domain-containing protein [Amycolatopsis magusensis]MBP2179481.1 RHS repeat-associated protein [Amycolatopsis magusensis]
MSNPLVAQAQSQTTGVTGIGIAESAVDLANGVSDGSWVEAGLGAVGVGLEVLSMVVDPIGTLASYGVSWLIEHVQPLKEALDWLAGDPPVIQSFSETWANVAAEVNAIAGDLGNEINNGTAGWQGEGADAYRGAAAEQADALAGAASLADGISAGVMIMGTVVAAVREFVRDLVAELVGKLIAWALEAAATLGFATPAIAVQATTAITKTISKISDFIRKLVKTIGNVSPKIRKIIDKLGEIIEKLSKMLRKGSKPGGGTTPSSAKTPPKSPDTTPNSPDTTPSSTDTTPDGVDTSPSSGTSPSAKNPDGSLRGDASNPVDRAEQPIGRCGGREPVDLATGEMFLVQTDLRLAGLLPLVLERTHVSSYRAGRLFGGSWSSTLDQRLEIDERGACYAGPDGVILVYPLPARDGSGVLPSAGSRWPLRMTEAGGYTITMPETGRTLHFPAVEVGVAKIAAVTDRNDQRIDFDYEGGTVCAVRHTGGYEVRVETAGELVSALRLRDHAAERDLDLVRFEYNEVRQLTTVINSSGRSMDFEYDRDGRMTKWVDRNGEWYGYHYDASGRCVRTEGSGNALAGTIWYDPAARMTVETDSLGQHTTYYFDELNKLVRQVDPLGHETRQEWDRAGRLVSRTDALGRTQRFTYGESGDVVAVTRPDGAELRAEYNELRQVTALTGADGSVWRREYDERGNLLAVVNPVGAVTRYAYDERGHLVSRTDPSGASQRVLTNAAGLPVVLTDPRNATLTYVRDPFGRIAAVTDANGNTTRYGWTVEGNVASRTFPDGGTEYWRHDGEGNRVEHVDVLGRITRTQMTHLDLPAATIDPAGNVHRFSYDSELRLTAVTNPQGLVWRYRYDAAGNLVGEEDFSGRTLTYSYDAAGQLISRTNGMGETVRFRRDLLGNVVERSTDSGSLASFEFDPAGRMLRAVNEDAVVTFERDPLGSVVAESVNGRTVRSDFDELGRRRHRSTPAGVETWWEYDETGRPAQLRTAGHSVDFGYDAAGREIERLLDTGTIIAQEWDGRDHLVGQTVSTVRGGLHNQARIIQQRRYAYAADGALREVEDALSGTRRFDVDSTGRVTGVTGANWVERYAYDAAGNLAEAAWPGADADAQGPRTYQGSRAQAAGSVRYGHDAQGRVVVRSKKRLSAKPDVWQYEWDVEDRLTGVVTPDGTRWRYRYDALGRRISKQELGADGTVAEQVDFTWDGATLAEQSVRNRSTTWDYVPGTFRPVSQVERVAELDSQTVDQRFYSIVTDLVGSPAELVDPAGELAWRSTTTLWGKQLSGDEGGVSVPLRFPGQYHDAETGLNYNYHRYYDPDSGQYQSVDPLGLTPGPNPQSYVHNPTAQVDPLGLAGCDPHLFRGSTEGYGGSPNMQRIGVTPTSTDPAVATAFATESEQWGNGIVHIATPDDVAGVPRLEASLGSLENEVPLDIPPSEFAGRASHTIPVSQAREILNDMGVSVPRQITDKQQLDAWLHQRTPMTDSQIAEFVRRATGG